jgi:hypothetical protein
MGTEPNNPKTLSLLLLALMYYPTVNSACSWKLLPTCSVFALRTPEGQS